MKSFVEFNNAKRAETNTEFGKQFYKFMNNSIYGRTMMNTRKFVQSE